MIEPKILVGIFDAEDIDKFGIATSLEESTNFKQAQEQRNTKFEVNNRPQPKTSTADSGMTTQIEDDRRRVVDLKMKYSRVSNMHVDIRAPSNVRGGQQEGCARATQSDAVRHDDCLNHDLHPDVPSRTDTQAVSSEDGASQLIRKEQDIMMSCGSSVAGPLIAQMLTPSPKATKGSVAVDPARVIGYQRGARVIPAKESIQNEINEVQDHAKQICPPVNPKNAVRTPIDHLDQR